MPVQSIPFYMPRNFSQFGKPNFSSRVLFNMTGLYPFNSSLVGIFYRVIDIETTSADEFTLSFTYMSNTDMYLKDTLFTYFNDCINCKTPASEILMNFACREYDEEFFEHFNRKVTEHIIIERLYSGLRGKLVLLNFENIDNFYRSDDIYPYHLCSYSSMHCDAYRPDVPIRGVLEDCSVVFQLHFVNASGFKLQTINVESVEI